MLATIYTLDNRYMGVHDISSALFLYRFEIFQKKWCSKYYLQNKFSKVSLKTYLNI